MKIRGCPGVPVHEGIPFVFITIHGVMTQFVNVSFLCVPVHEDTTENSTSSEVADLPKVLNGPQGNVVSDCCVN